MKKRAQVTIYIILGLVLLAVLGASIFILTRIAETRQEAELREVITASDKEAINNYVQNCYINITSKAIEKIYLQGGYISPDQSYITSFHSLNLTCLYCSDKKNRLLTIPLIEQQINNFIKDNGDFITCLDNFNAFRETKNWNITVEPMNVDTKITAKNILIVLNYPITLQIGDNKDSITEFKTVFPYRLGEIIDAAREQLNVIQQGKYYDIGNYIRRNSNILIEGQYFNKDYEMMQFTAYNQEELPFTFVIYNPILDCMSFSENPFTIIDNCKKNSQSNTCCVSSRGQCYENPTHCDTEITSQSCESIPSCHIGCCNMNNIFDISNFNECQSEALKLNIQAEFSSFGTSLLSYAQAEKISGCRLNLDNEGCCITDSICERTSEEACIAKSGNFNLGLCSSILECNCAKTNNQGCGPDNNVYSLDECGNYDEKIKICEMPNSKCKIELGQATCVYTSCDLQVKDDYQLDNIYHLENGQSLCAQYLAPGEQHYIAICENGEIKSEGMGSDREGICQGGEGKTLRVDNHYENCMSCGSPANDEDWQLFIPERTTTSICTRSSCLDAGDCIINSSFDNYLIGNTKCYPKYPPGNNLACSECGFNADANADMCEKDECIRQGWCEAIPSETQNLAIFDRKTPGLCLATSMASVDFGSSLLSQYCTSSINEWMLYESIRHPTVLQGFDEFKNEIFNKLYQCNIAENPTLNQCDLCANSGDIFKDRKCTSEKCSFLGQGCHFEFNLSYGTCTLLPEFSIDKTAPEITIANPLEESEINWNAKTFQLNLNTNEPSQCRYLESGDAEWPNMIPIQGSELKIVHAAVPTIPMYFPTEDKQYMYYWIRCRDASGNENLKTLTLATIPKQESEEPNILFVNLQGKIITSTSFVNLLVVSDTATDCKYQEVTSEVFSDNFEPILGKYDYSTLSNSMQSCTTKAGSWECSEFIPPPSLGPHYFIVQCKNDYGLYSEKVPVVFTVVSEILKS